MNNRALLAGAAVGAAVAYMLDPDRGGRRRALVRDKIIRGAHVTGRALDATARDIANRSRGLASATRTRWSGEAVDDWRLVERVRAKLGRVCSHPRAIDVDVYVASFLGGTGILIVVGVALDLVDKIEAQLLVRQYEGFMRGGEGPRRGGPEMKPVSL